MAILARNGIPPDQAGPMTEAAVISTLDRYAELAGRPTGGTASRRYVNTRRKRKP